MRQVSGQAALDSKKTYDSWELLSIVFEHAGHQRGWLTLEDLVLCAKTCKYWRFCLLSMLPLFLPVSSAIPEKLEKGVCETFREGLKVHTVLERLDSALKAGNAELCTIAKDFIYQHWRSHTVREFLEHVPQNARDRLGALLVASVVEIATKDGMSPRDLLRIRITMRTGVRHAIIFPLGEAD